MGSALAVFASTPISNSGCATRAPCAPCICASCSVRSGPSNFWSSRGRRCWSTASSSSSRSREFHSEYILLSNVEMVYTYTIQPVARRWCQRLPYLRIDSAEKTRRVSAFVFPSIESFRLMSHHRLAFRNTRQRENIINTIVITTAAVGVGVGGVSHVDSRESGRLPRHPGFVFVWRRVMSGGWVV